MRISDWSSDVCSSDLIAVDGDDDLFFMRLPHQFMRRPVGDEPAVVDDGDPVAKLLRLFQIMGGAQHGDTALVHLPAIGPELLAQFDVDTGGRLENGRASCRGSVCEYVSISVVAVAETPKQ